NFLEESKQRCSYLLVTEEGATGRGGRVLDFGRAKRAKELRDAVVNYVGEKFGCPLVKKLWPIAAMILVAVVTAKTTQVIMEAPLKSEAQVAAARIPATDKTPAASSAPEQGKRRTPGIFPTGVAPERSEE